MSVIWDRPRRTLLKRKSERVAWAADLANYFERAISPGDPKSLEFARNTAVLEYAAKKKEFDERCNVYWKTNRVGGTGSYLVEPTRGEMPPRPIPARHIKQMASGDINTGVGLAARSGMEYGEGPDWYPQLPEHYDLGDGPEKSWAAMHSDLESKRQYVLVIGRQVASLADKIGEIRAVKEKLDSMRNFVPEEEGEAEVEV